MRQIKLDLKAKDGETKQQYWGRGGTLVASFRSSGSFIIKKEWKIGPLVLPDHSDQEDSGQWSQMELGKFFSSDPVFELGDCCGMQ